MISDGCRSRERVYVFRMRIDNRDILLHVRKVAQRLDAARRGTGTDRDQDTRASAHILYTLSIMRRGNRSLDE